MLTPYSPILSPSRWEFEGKKRVREQVCILSVLSTFACFMFIAPRAIAQDPPDAPALKTGDKADILFVASAPGTKVDENGKPALGTLDPIAFFVGSEIRGCAAAQPAPGEDSVPKIAIQTLNRAYASGRRYPLWWGGSPWGEAEAVRSCIDESGGDYLDLVGCFRLHPDSTHPAAPNDFKGTVWTGSAVVASHTALRVKANSEERASFLRAASDAFAARHVRIAPASIHVGVIWKTQLRAAHTALAGNTLVQLASKTPLTFYSYRVFLVVEDDGGTFLPVLSHFHRATIRLESVADLPKVGTLLDEDNDADKESFLDNFPLFPGEPDSIISEHTYYESWSYSIYRRVGADYHLLYTGCGGGT